MRQTLIAPLILAIVTLTACSKGAPESGAGPVTVSGGRSGIVAVSVIAESTKNVQRRSAALLGVFISEYASIAPAAMAAESALIGIGTQMQIAISQNTVQDPDFELLQAFADALQVDIADMLNRSNDRQQALDTYRDALNNVASRSNDRFKELESALEQLEEELRTAKRELADAERDLRNALKEKDYSSAGDKQKAVNDLQATVAETDLKATQTEDLVDTLDELLTLYGEKILAIDSNREILISGVKVVDVPGIEDLEIIERVRPSRRSGNDSFDALFDGTNIQ
jgi:hypothetical protein